MLASSAPAAPTVETFGVRLEPLAPLELPTPLPLVEIEEPEFGDLLDARLARRTPVKLRIENTQLSADREGVAVALDGKRPRRWLADRPLTLGDLLPADAELEPGTHVLLAVALAADGRSLRVEAPAKKPLSLVTFFVGARPAKSGDVTPQSLFCLSPAGTYYTKPDEPLLFDVLAFGAQKTASKLRVRSRLGAFELPFDASHAFMLRGLPRGDVWLSVGDAPGPISECVVTLNPSPEARP